MSKVVLYNDINGWDVCTDSEELNFDKKEIYYTKTFEGHYGEEEVRIPIINNLSDEEVEKFCQNVFWSEESEDAEFYEEISQNWKKVKKELPILNNEGIYESINTYVPIEYGKIWFFGDELSSEILKTIGDASFSCGICDYFEVKIYNLVDTMIYVEATGDEGAWIFTENLMKFMVDIVELVKYCYFENWRVTRDGIKEFLNQIDVENSVMCPEEWWENILHYVRKHPDIKYDLDKVLKKYYRKQAKLEWMKLKGIKKSI